MANLNFIQDFYDPSKVDTFSDLAPSTAPTWWPVNQNGQVANWWRFTNADTKSFGYAKRITDNTSTNGTMEYHNFMQYGQNEQRWARAVFTGTKYVVSNMNVNQVTGYASFHLAITPRFVWGRKTQYAAQVGYRSIVRIFIGDRKVFERDGSTIDNFDYPDGVTPIEWDVTLPPLGRFISARVRYTVTYPNHEFEDQDWSIGALLENPNMAQYVPFGIKKSTGWLDCDGLGQHYQFNGTNWKLFPLQNDSTANQPNKGNYEKLHSNGWTQIQRYRRDV